MGSGLFRRACMEAAFVRELLITEFGVCFESLFRWLFV